MPGAVISGHRCKQKYPLLLLAEKDTLHLGIDISYTLRLSQKYIT